VLWLPGFASDLKTRVLLLEAGGPDDTELITNPNRWPMTLGSELDWGFMAEPNPQLNGRAIRYFHGEGSWRAVLASTFRRGLGDTELIGASTLPNRAIHRGIMKPFSTCIATVLRHMPEALIRITAVYTEWSTCSPRRALTAFSSLALLEGAEVLPTRAT